MTSRSGTYQPSFSIITPTFNRADRLVSSVRSVLEQDEKNWELIIVDDASTDDTEEVVKQFLSDGRIKYKKLPENCGVNAARNSGIAESSGEWVVFLDSDDRLAPGALATIKRLTETTGKKIIFAACRNLDGKSTSKAAEFSGALSYEEYLGDKVIGEYLTTINRECFDQIRFPEDIRGGEGITWKVMAKEYGGCYISNEVVRIYDNKGSDRLTIKKNNYSRLAKVFKKEVQTLWSEYLTHYPLKLIEKTGKYLVYSLMAYLK